MLRKFASYSSVAFCVMLFSGVLTKVAEAVVGDVLSKREFGSYWHFVLVLELVSGVFIVGIDHGLVTFVNREKANHARFVRLLLTYGLVLTALTTVVGSTLRGLGVIGPITALGVITAGPFVFAELGKITFRARLEKRREFGFLLLQSLMWSVGCIASIHALALEETPILWHVVAVVLVAAGIARVLAGEARRGGGAALCTRPFGAEYGLLWSTYRPLWVAGAAFLANTHVPTLVVDLSENREGLASWRFISIMLMFLHRPIMLLQRAALPIFTQDREHAFDGFRKLVRLNLVFFPLLALLILGAYPIVLRYGTLAKYDGTWIYLAVVVAATPFMSTEFLVGTLSMALDKPRNNRNAHVLTAAINIPVTIFCVRQFELLGAAIASAFYVTLFCCTMFWFSRRDLPEYVVFATRKLLVAAPALWLCTWIVSRAEGIGGAVGMTCLAGAVYLVATRAVGIWRVDHLKWVASKVRRR